MGGINIRKTIAIAVLFLLALLLFYLILLDGFLRVVYVFFIIVCAALIFTDFKVLKLGVLNKLYLFIEAPQIANQSKRSLEDLLSLFKSGYFSKKYYEVTSNRQLKIVKKVEDSKFCVDSRAVFQNLRKGLTFDVVLKKETKINNSPFDYDSAPVGLAKVEHVAELSRFKVVKWEETKEYGEEIRNLKKGNLSNIRAYMQVTVQEEFQESSVEDLERAYHSLERIYSKRWRSLR